MIARTLENYNRGRQPPTPSRWQANAAIRFEDRIMGPVRLYNTAGEIHAIFAAALTEEEGRAPSYCQASDLITFLHLWRRFKGEVSDLMRVTMKQWRLPVWASEKAKKKKEHLRDERWWALGIEPVEPPPPVIMQAL